ncbi:MAG TPA: glutathione binding-like protein, partial [Reyranella sp.]|nr:glutathione binding-like protein [Reyranella sp.]
ERAREVWQIADKRLGANEWAVGGRYSIADIHLFRLYWRTRDALEPKAGGFANIEAHYQRVMARPAVRKTIEVEERIGYSLPR